MIGKTNPTADRLASSHELRRPRWAVMSAAALAATGALALSSGCGGEAGAQSDVQVEIVAPSGVAMVEEAKAQTPATPEAVAPAKPGMTQEEKRRAIVETAFKYAWDAQRGPISKRDNFNGYTDKARKHVDWKPEHEKNSGIASPQTDCGVFVSIVMRESGVDPEYPKRGTHKQLDYLEDNSNPKNPDRKYDRINVKSVKDLRPGDIAIATIAEKTVINGKTVDSDNAGHTYVVTKHPGDDGVFDNKNGRVVDDDNPAMSASWYGHPPQAAHVSLDYKKNVPFVFFRPR